MIFSLFVVFAPGFQAILFCYINIINCKKPSIAAWQSTDRGMYR